MTAKGKRKRKRDQYDPTVPSDANDERCEFCGASYAAARNPLAATAGEHCRALIAAAGRDGSRFTADLRAGLAGDGARVTIDGAVGDMARAKRATWEASHGPGRCVADESTHTGRTSLACAMLGWPDTAAILASVPQLIDDDEPNRTIWCALPVGPAPNPPSLASILIEAIDGDDGAREAFDELDSLRASFGVPSANL